MFVKKDWKFGTLMNLTQLIENNLIRNHAPVVQWIEHWSPEPKIWVRLPAGVPLSLMYFTSVPIGEWHYLVYSQTSGMK